MKTTMFNNKNSENLKFPNQCEKIIFKNIIANSKSFREKLRAYLFLHPKINKYAYEFVRIKMFHGMSYFTKIILPTKRVLPTFMIPGFPKSGSSSLWYYLKQHPQLYTPKQKELHFFSYNYRKGLKYYALNFPPQKYNQNILSFEASQSYLHDKFAMVRIKNEMPKMKFIVLLRNPVQKTISLYNSLKSKKLEMDSLDECINNEDERLRIWTKRLEYGMIKPYTYGICLPYLHLATYVKHIKNALKLFPRNQFLFLDTNELKNSPHTVNTKCFKFLGLSDMPIDVTEQNTGNYSFDVLKEATTESPFLAKYFRSFNKQLEELIGMQFNWK